MKNGATTIVINSNFIISYNTLNNSLFLEMSENGETGWRAVGGAEAAQEEKAAAPTEEDEEEEQKEELQQRVQARA